MAVVTTSALALRSYPYGETSLILRFYTEDLGLVGVMAKGARRRGSRGSAVPDTFSRGVLTAYVKAGRDLHTMKDFATDRPRRALGRDVLRFAAASVLGEILLRHSAAEANPTLFAGVDRSLDALATVAEEDLTPELLRRSWSLVREMGYQPDLEQCVACGRPLGEEVGRFDLAAGGVACARCGHEGAGRRLGPRARGQLGDLLQGREGGPPLRKPHAHLRLLHDYVAFHLSEGRPLDAFRVFEEVAQGLDGLP